MSAGRAASPYKPGLKVLVSFSGIAAAGQSRGTLTAGECSVFTGETTGHSPCYKLCHSALEGKPENVFLPGGPITVIADHVTAKCCYISWEMHVWLQRTTCSTSTALIQHRSISNVFYSQHLAL